MPAPTDEQSEAVSFFQKQDSLKINAYAGAGKTSTLRLMAQASRRSGLYIAFNKSIADEAKLKFPSNVACSTSHSLAFHVIKGFYPDSGKMTGSLTPNLVAKALDIPEFTVLGDDDNRRSLSRITLAAGILNACRLFMQSADNEIDNRHAKPPISVRAGGIDVISEYKELVVRRARALWSAMRDPTGAIPLGHDGYLKLWALSEPILRADYVLMDEAQDSNPALLGVLASQSAQVVYVGDPYQQIYEWRGAVNAMQTLQTKNSTVLSRSFRFGDSIADAAWSILTKLKATHAISGSGSIPSQVWIGDASKYRSKDSLAILNRTNAGVMGHVVGALSEGHKPHVIGGTAELQRLLKGVQGLKMDIPSDHPDFFGFSNWKQVVIFSESDEGVYLRTLVKLVQQFGEVKLKNFLESCTDKEENADVVISTAHKGKGREWYHVQLSSDFDVSVQESKKEHKSQVEKVEDEKAKEAEYRLLYVALTRATHHVRLTPAVASHFSIGGASFDESSDSR